MFLLHIPFLHLRCSYLRFQSLDFERNDPTWCLRPVGTDCKYKIRIGSRLKCPESYEGKRPYRQQHPCPKTWRASQCIRGHAHEGYVGGSHEGVDKVDVNQVIRGVGGSMEVWSRGMVAQHLGGLSISDAKLKHNSLIAFDNLSWFGTG